MSREFGPLEGKLSKIVYVVLQEARIWGSVWSVDLGFFWFRDRLCRNAPAEEEAGESAINSDSQFPIKA